LQIIITVDEHTVVRPALESVDVVCTTRVRAQKNYVLL
jgi:hypothetical protein